jgi:hypothetical protein
MERGDSSSRVSLAAKELLVEHEQQQVHIHRGLQWHPGQSQVAAQCTALNTPVRQIA